MADDSTSEATATGDVVRPKRVAGTILDMVRSLGVMAIVVAVTLIFVPGLLHPNKSQRFQPVSYAGDVEGFHEVTKLRAYIPAGLSPSWYANSATLTHRDDVAHLHIGFVTPTNKYLAIEESNAPAEAFIDDVVGARRGGEPDQFRIAGVNWVRTVSVKGEKTLTRTANGVTIVITGSGTLPQQQEFAAALRPA